MYIYQYYVVADPCYGGEIYEIFAGPFHSSDDAKKWISSNPMSAAGLSIGLPDYLRVVHAKVEVSL